MPSLVLSYLGNLVLLVAVSPILEKGVVRVSPISIVRRAVLVGTFKYLIVLFRTFILST